MTPLLDRRELVGRHRELGRLSEQLSLALSGTGQVALVRGEPGIGKTRLLEELCQLAGVRGAKVRMGHAREPEQTRPFGAVSDAFGVSLGASDPTLAQLADQVYSRPATAQTLLDTTVEDHYIVEQFVEVFELLCSRSALVVGVDNLQWADSSSLLLTRRLIDLCRQYPVLVLLSTRPSERPEVGAVVADVASQGGTTLDLGPLDSVAVSQLAGQFFGASPGPRLETQLGRASGNPLFVLELATTMAGDGLVKVGSDGKAEIEAGKVLPALSSTVLHRLHMLPQTTVELLRCAALLGPVVDLDELAAWTGQSALEIAGALRAAVRSGLVMEEGRDLSFRHELVHEALYNDWPLPLRRALHRELGRMLAKAGAPSYRVAYHFAAGATAGAQDTEAMDWLRRAGLEIAPRAPVEGAQLLEKAVELAPKQGSSRDTLRADLALAFVRAGKLEEGERLARAVVAETANDEVRGRAAWSLGFSLLGRYRWLEAKEISHDALAAGVEPAPTRVLVELVERTAAMMSGPLEAGPASALGAMEALSEEAKGLGDTWAQCNCLAGVVMAEVNAGQLERAVAHGDEAVHQAESLSPIEVATCPAYIAYVWALEEQDRFDDALAVLEHQEQLSGPLPLSLGSALSSTLRGRAHFAAGRWDDALANLGPVAAWRYSEGWADMVVLRALIALHRDELGRARDDLALVDRALASGGGCSSIDYLASARAFLLEAEGEAEKALEQLRWLWQLTEVVPYAMAKPKIGPQLARLSVQLGDPGMAHQVAAGLEGLASSNPSTARIAGAARWCRGLAEDDTGALLDAVELYQRSQRPLDQGLVCEDAAAAFAARNSLDRARSLLGAALEHYDDLLAAQRGAAARARLRALGVRTGAHGPRRRPQSGWGALTDAERRVALLVSEHLSNPEVAERLFISRRTVETHVSNALVKLGCVSRRELTAAVLERQTAPANAKEYRQGPS